MRHVLVATILASVGLSATAGASPLKLVKVAPLSPQQREYKELKQRLADDSSPQAHGEIVELMRRGDTSYIGTDLGSIGFRLDQLKTLGAELGKAPPSKAFENRVWRTGFLMNIQHGLRDAARRKAEGNPYLDMGLDKAIRSAREIKMEPQTLLELLHAYGLDKHDVEKHTDFRFRN